MEKKFETLKPFSQCRKYNLPLWQCPQFLFLIFGTIIIFSSIFIYFIGNRYVEDPLLVGLLVLLVAAVLFVLAYFIVQSFEKIFELSRLKTEFIGVISHQLQTPISSLNWALELLMSGRIGSFDKSQMEYLQILKDNTNRMLEIVSELIVVSRLETALEPPEKQEFFLNEVVKEVVEKLKERAKSLELQINIKEKEKLAKIFANLNQIKLTVESLLDNAICYSRQKGVIKINIEKRKNNIYFEIKDEGFGIPKEDQKYIFQKFFRAKNILEHQIHGLGLGLFITKKIIERNGGKIGFKSEENKGSTFWFMLPLKK